MIRFVPKLESVLNQLAKRYTEDLADFRDYVKIDFSNELLSDDFHQTFYQLLLSEKLDKYGPLKYYWLRMVEDFFFILELHYDEQDGGLSDDDQDFTDEERQEELLSAWEQTPFASALEGMLEEGLGPEDASMALIPLMESQILSFAYLHFYAEEFDCETAFLYNMTPELGDYENRLNLIEAQQYIEFETPLELYPAVPVAEIDYERKVLGLDNNGETDYLDMLPFEHFISLGKSSKKIALLAGVELDESALLEKKAELQATLESSPERVKLCNSQVSLIVISAMDNYCCPNLAEVLHLPLWKNKQELEQCLDLALATLTSQHIEMAWDFSGEHDVDAKFVNPLTGKKDLLLTILQQFVPLLIAGKITSAQECDMRLLYQKVKNTDLISEKLDHFLFELLK